MCGNTDIRKCEIRTADVGCGMRVRVDGCKDQRTGVLWDDETMFQDLLPYARKLKIIFIF